MTAGPLAPKLNRRRKLWLFAAAWMALTAPPTFSQATPAPTAADADTTLLLDYKAAPRANFTTAAFRFWSPAYDQPIRGIVVLTPGANGDGRKKLSDPAWRDFARKYRLALVACFMQGPDYYDASGGTGDALLEALTDFARQSSHPEIALAPLLLYGESAGGQFNYDFAIWKPARVIAFVVNKGGFYSDRPPDPQAYAVPGLFFLGEKDEDYRVTAITRVWTEGRRQGALWALAPQPNSGHEFTRTAAVAQVFFEAVLKGRLPDAATALAPMKPIRESQGWLGNLTTHEFHAAARDTRPARDAAWLPDEASAIAWKAFVTSDGPLPRAAPPAARTQPPSPSTSDSFPKS